MSELRERLNRLRVKGKTPPERLTVSEWAAKNRVLVRGSSNEPGAWRNERTPYLVEIMDSLSPGNGIERVVFQKSVQCGGTEAGNNWLGFVFSQDPDPMLMVLPTLDLARKVSRSRVSPLIRASKALKDLGIKDSGQAVTNNVLQKDFPGGTLLIAGAKSGTGLRSMPCRYLFCDEVDAFPADTDDEGNPLEIAIGRTATFSRNKKVFIVSTPKLRGDSHIEPLYEMSDCRRYHVPCKHCGHYQALEWKHLQFNSDAATVRDLHAHYACVECGGVIDEEDKPVMLSNGMWVAGRESDDPALRGYHLNSLYSPIGWLSWNELAWKWVESMRDMKKKKFHKMHAFVNTILAETWDDSVEKVQWHELRERQEARLGGALPMSVRLLTCGVDVQKDRLEASVWGWGDDDECWAVDHYVIYGSTDLDDVWTALDDYISKRWKRADGLSQSPKRVMVDCGYATNKVKMYAKKRKVVHAVMGQGGGKPKAMWWKGADQINIAVNVVKDYLMDGLKIDPPGPRSVHLPKDEWCNEEFMRQLTAERRNSKGVWEAKRANEALDAWVYAFIGWQTFGVNKVRLGAKGMEKVRKSMESRFERDEV